MIVEPQRRAVFGPGFEIDPQLPQTQMRWLASVAASAADAAKIDNFRQHMYQEMIGLDLDQLMATMEPDPAIYVWGLDLPHDVGYDAVRSHYARSLGARAWGLSMDVSRVIVDEEALVVEGLGLFGLEFVREHFGLSLSSDRPAIAVKNLVVVVDYRPGSDVMAAETQYFDGEITESDLVFLDGAGR